LLIFRAYDIIFSKRNPKPSFPFDRIPCVVSSLLTFPRCAPTSSLLSCARVSASFRGPCGLRLRVMRAASLSDNRLPSSSPDDDLNLMNSLSSPPPNAYQRLRTKNRKRSGRRRPATRRRGQHIHARTRANTHIHLHRHTTQKELTRARAQVDPSAVRPLCPGKPNPMAKVVNHSWNLMCN
jgi:hypothetical protein